MNQKPTIGRIVQYGIGRDHTGAVQYRPAIVVNDWGGNYDQEYSGPNLQVLIDGTNDGKFQPLQPGDDGPAGASPEEAERGSAWRTSVIEGSGVGQWRWPPRETVAAPAPVVEVPAEKTHGLTFGEALEALKQGKRVAREGWNGKGMWIALTPGSRIPVETARAGAAAHAATEIVRAARDMRAAKGRSLTIGAHIDMRAADGTLVIGWLASQTDMLAEDWVVLE